MFEIQKILFAGLGGSGIVAVLVIAGIALRTTGAPFGELAIAGGVLIGIALGVLGVVGVISRLM